jgi:hypothetical protein
MFGTKNTFINLDFRTIDEVLADKYISKEAKDATSIKFVRSALEDFSTLIIEDDERKDNAQLIQPIPEQQKSDN